MTNLLDFTRLSDYVNAIADRKMASFSTSISSSTGYLRDLVNQSRNYAQESLAHANSAGDYAESANGAAATSLIVLNDFTSTYLGVQLNEPQRSNQNNAINANAWYIRSTDGRLRYVTQINSQGVPIYADATVSADPASLAAAGVGVFLSLSQTQTTQLVRGPVTFSNTTLVPRVTAWTSQQAVPAIDFTDGINRVTTNLNAEIDRAKAAEAQVNTNKVSKSGDNMSGVLGILANGENASLLLRNTTGGSGRVWRLRSSDNGVLHLIDDSANAIRMTFQTNGDISFGGNTTTPGATTSGQFFVNQGDANDAGFGINRGGVIRWAARRAESSLRFYIARFNAQGAFQDTPFSISEADGAVTLNRTIVNDTLFARGNFTVEGAGPSIVLNNTSSADAVMLFRHNGVTRWGMGRSPNNAIFYINRLNGSGNYVDTPFRIDEASGVTIVKALNVDGQIGVGTSVTTPQVFTTSNGQGRNVSIGDDAWIGDGNIVNTMVLRGQQDFNAGFISFGNSGGRLGCNANDGKLRYNDQEVLIAGSFGAANLGFGRGSGNVTVTNAGGSPIGTVGVRWTISPDGLGGRVARISGEAVFNSENNVVCFPWPFAIQDVLHWGVSSYYALNANASNFNDSIGMIARRPNTTDIRVFAQRTSSDSRFPVTVNWWAEVLMA